MRRIFHHMMKAYSLPDLSLLVSLIDKDQDTGLSYVRLLINVYTVIIILVYGLKITKKDKKNLNLIFY